MPALRPWPMTCRPLPACACAFACWFACLAFPSSGQALPLPPRPVDAMPGGEFVRSLSNLSLVEREERIVAQVLLGNVPGFWRVFCSVTVTPVTAGRTNTATFQVAPDYLAIGSDADYFLAPLTPGSAQQLADRLDCSLPTRKMVDAIYAAATLKLAPSNLPPSAAMTTVSVFARHNEIVRRQRSQHLEKLPPGTLIAGHKKDVVVTPRLAHAPGKVAIYGWHRLDGTPIQPLYLGHTQTWVDYSHGLRLVQQRLTVNGVTSTIAQVLADPALAPLLSDEGTYSSPRYPATNAAPTRALATNDAPSAFAGFQPGPHLGEQTLTFTHEPGVRIHLNAPARETFTTNKPVQLIFYALPNGNTIEQTIGKKLQPGDDWHYDLQHIGAQTRFLRDLLPDRAIVVAYLEAAEKSWPAWRKKHDPANRLIPGVLARVTDRFKEFPRRLTLNGHSGGGSFIFGYLNAIERVPGEVERIAFLDSDYAYDPAQGHADKLAAWLKSADAPCLSVLAYHDDIARLNGKPFVSVTGGTWYRSHLMQTNLAAHFAFTSARAGDLEHHTALGGRVEFLLHTNPDRAILHTVQVEKNGFIHSLLSGTPQENRGYRYFGPRAYDQWIH